MLNDVETYCNAWGFKINVENTKALIFEKGGRHTNYNFFLYGEKFEIVTSFKYLGIHFFKNGGWYRSQKCITEHASKAMHRLFSVNDSVNMNLAHKKNVSCLILLCQQCLWGLHEGKDIENIHTKFLRKILCVNKSTNLAGLYGELVPLQVIRKNQCVSLQDKIITCRQ